MQIFDKSISITNDLKARMLDAATVDAGNEFHTWTGRKRIFSDFISKVGPGNGTDDHAPMNF